MGLNVFKTNSVFSGQTRFSPLLANKPFAEILVKVAIFGLLAAGIYYQLTQHQNIHEINQLITEHFAWSVALGLIAVTILMAANWAVETLKWQRLMSQVQVLPYRSAFKGVLFGTTMSLFTPNRIGEYGGRLWMVQKGKRIESAIATAIGSMAQWVINVGLGGMMAVGLFLTYNDMVNQALWFATCAAFVTLLVVLLFYFHLHWFYELLDRYKVLGKYKHYLRFLEHYSYKQLTGILVLSLGRYIIFCGQLMLLIWIFGIKIDFLVCSAIISTLFFCQTLIPSIAFTELGIRGNLALYLFGFVTNSGLNVLASTFALWGINLLVPALTGYFLFLQMHFTKSKSYANYFTVANTQFSKHPSAGRG